MPAEAKHSCVCGLATPKWHRIANAATARQESWRYYLKVKVKEKDSSPHFSVVGTRLLPEKPPEWLEWGD